MKFADIEQGEVLSELPICDKNEETEQNINEAQRLTPYSSGDFENIARTEGCAKSLSSNKCAGLASVNGRLLSKNKQSKILPGRHRKRLILKNGSANVIAKNVAKRRQRYLQDLFITLVDIQWRWNLLVFSMGFIITWLFFAIIWWLINYSHGDFLHMNDTNWEPCVHNIKSFTSAFLFSLETQHTIGYGSRYVNEECPEAVFVLCLQSITGVMIQCFIVGMVFAKFSRPKKRQQTLMFSQNAIVCLRDGKLCLMFRVGNMRKSPVIGAQISLHLINRKTTTEGEVIPYYHSQLDIRHDSASNSFFLSWPVVVIHEINQHSPLYTMSAEELILKDKFELIAILEGTTESTGQSFQARSSYLSQEIVWGHRFEQVISYCKETGDFLVDYGKFNNTYETETPLCSAKQFYEFQRSFSMDCERYENHNKTRDQMKTTGSLRKPVFDIIESRSINSTE
ncbi:G protein-activated inward rectifier potassium channel 3-like [Limulus polyphemus]|uniref:G protein-activated inward rectifier potassium channel 3-like n=1 Tax=Limulus polyphemus TaxID=6850 RepID=A0ABM1RZH3_LIMPO|nr:G protein-activated inward rectifier potassium channel 3-like [Limulus polyphemus]XP_022236779.1 G protein-activated inward rectifier potassium channel 3-like [Limulus polyphemus]XP_022236785.1 G protein-activated inward rectifier potassium channel 3-like [Limulus polyphemus]